MANIVDIIVRSKDQTKQGFSSAKGEASGFQGSMKRIGETAAGFLGANLVANAAQRVKDFVGDSISAASDLNETVSKTNQVFGSSAGGIHSWAKGAVDSMGLSRQAAEGAANSMGLVFTQVGFNTDAASKMSRSWTQLAADVQSFANVPAAEVLDAMQSATRGEYDALQRFVPSINAAKVEQEALKESGKKTSKELDDQDKILAIQTLMFQQTKKAQGDFARTSDQNANASRKAAAAMDNAKASLGQGLLPITLLGSKILEKFGKVLAAHPGLLMAIAAPVGVIIGLVKAWSIATGILNAVMSANPIALVVIGLAALVAGLVVAYNRSETFRRIVQGAFGGVRAVFSGMVAAGAAVINWFRDLPGRITGFLSGLPGRMASIGGSIIRGLINGILDSLGPLGGALRGVGSFIAEHKGPESKDRQLLVPAGQAIMQGLVSGIISRLPTLQGALGRVTGTMGTTGTPGGSAPALGLAGAGGGPSIAIHVTTNASAAEIAREVAWQMRTAGV